MCGVWSFIVARQDIATMVTLYVRQDRAPARRSGCATLHSAAKASIERMADGYTLALIYMRRVIFLETTVFIFDNSQLGFISVTFLTFFT